MLGTVVHTCYLSTWKAKTRTAVSSRPADLQSEMLRTQYHRRRRNKIIKRTVIDGGVNKLEKTGKEEGEGEGERGWRDAGIRLVVQI